MWRSVDGGGAITEAGRNDTITNPCEPRARRTRRAALATNSWLGIIDTPTLKHTDPFLRAKKIYFLNPASSNKVMSLLT